MTDPLGLPRNRNRDGQMARFTDIAGKAGIHPKDVLNHPKSTEMVKAADASSGSMFHIYPAWQICSGFAHGRQWAMLSMLERVAVLEDPVTGIGLYRVTSDLAHIAWAVGAGYDVLRHAGSLYQRGATNHVAQLLA